MAKRKEKPMNVSGKAKQSMDVNRDTGAAAKGGRSASTVRITNLHDAAEHIGEVLKCVKKEHLERAYKIKNWEDDNDFLVQLCKLSGKLLRGGTPDLTTAAKTLLHDWLRKIPFFVPPPRDKDDLSEEQYADGAGKEEAVAVDQASAARKAIANVISSQQLKDVRVQEDLFTEKELKGENPGQNSNTAS